MKIAFFCGKYPYFEPTTVNSDQYFCGGSIVAAFKLINEVVKKNINCSVFTTSYNNKEHFERYTNLEIYRYPTNFHLYSSNISFRLMYDPLRYSADIVHVHFDLPPTPIWGYYYAKIKNQPLIVTYHGDWLDNYGSFIRKIFVKIINSFILDKILSRADIIISPSKYYISESRFLKKYEEKIKVIPNGVDIDQFNIPISKSECKERLKLSKDSIIILYFGALTSRKGPEILIKSMKKILKTSPNVTLLICGTGDLESTLKKLVKTLSLENNVRFCGYIEENLKSIYYNSADIFCLPSTVSSEVFPLVLLEASASKLPLIVSDLETFKCIITEGYNGHFTKKNDVQDLAEKIEYLICNEGERLKLGFNARSFVEQFSWTKISDATIVCYQELLEKKTLNSNSW